MIYNAHIDGFYTDCRVYDNKLVQHDNCTVSIEAGTQQFDDSILQNLLNYSYRAQVYLLLESEWPRLPGCRWSLLT